jgi:hypothetical protein
VCVRRCSLLDSARSSLVNFINTAESSGSVKREREFLIICISRPMNDFRKLCTLESATEVVIRR